MTGEHEALLRIRDLRIRIGDAHPVDGAALEVGAGGFVALVGASGSGKTLTALATIGLLPKAAEVAGGTIHLGGQELTGLSEAGWRRVRGRRIAMIFQEPMTSLNPVMTVGRQIIEAVRIAGDASADPRATAIQALRAVQIPEPEMRLRAYPHQLSGGLRQRVMIAMALACNPALLIADEPTTALDVTVQAGIVRLLQKIRRERNLAILLITHDIALAAEAAEEIAVMSGGRIVEAGPAERIVSRPEVDYTASLIEHCRKREEWRNAT